MPTPRTFTRAELTALLVAADRPDLATGLHSRRLTYDERGYGASALALTYDHPGDLAVAVLVIARTLGDDGIDFAAATTAGSPSHPEIEGFHEAYWPGWSLSEPTIEQWWDQITACHACEAADGRCGDHRHAPWESATQVARPHLELVP